MKITEILNTKYLARHWVRDLSYFLELLTTDKKNKRWDAMVDRVRSGGKPYEIDLGGARICRDVMNYITQYDHEDVVFVDSVDSVRNSMLEENRYRRKLDYTVVPLPTFNNINNLHNYLMSLKGDVVYGRGDMHKGLAIRLAVIIQALRPEITLDLSGDYESLYSYVSSMINMHDYKCNTVSYVINGSIFTQDVSSDGTVHIPGEGDIKWDSFVSRYACVPTEFGNKQVPQNDTWRRVIKTCIEEIPDFIEKRTSITDYFSKE